MYCYKTKELISVKTMSFKFNDCTIRCHFKIDGDHAIISIGIKNKKALVENWISKITLYNHKLNQYEIESILIDNPPFCYFGFDLLKNDKSNFKKMYNMLFESAINSKNETNDYLDVQNSIRDYHSKKKKEDNIPKLYYWHDFDRGSNKIQKEHLEKIKNSFWATEKYINYLNKNNRNVKFTNDITKAAIPKIF